MGYSRYAPLRNAPGQRQNWACFWYVTARGAAEFLVPLYRRFQHLLPQQLEHDFTDLAYVLQDPRLVDDFTAAAVRLVVPPVWAVAILLI